MCECFACMSVSAPTMYVVSGGQKKVSNTLELSYRWLWAAILALETEPQSCVRAASAIQLSQLSSPGA